MSRATRKGGKEAGLILVGKKVDTGKPSPAVLVFTPLNTDKPAFRHLKVSGRSGYIGMNSRAKLTWRDDQE
jgi:hypothetical protein